MWLLIQMIFTKLEHIFPHRILKQVWEAVPTVAITLISHILQWICPTRARTETQLWPEQGLVSCFVSGDLEQDQEQSNSYHLIAKPCTNLGTIVSLIAQYLWMGTKHLLSYLCKNLSRSISLPLPPLTYGDVDSDRPDRIMLSCDFLFPFFFFFSFLREKLRSLWQGWGFSSAWHGGRHTYLGVRMCGLWLCLFHLSPSWPVSCCSQPRNTES